MNCVTVSPYICKAARGYVTGKVEEDLLAGYERNGNWQSLDQWHADACLPPQKWDAWVFHQRNEPIGWDPTRFGVWEVNIQSV